MLTLPRDVRRFHLYPYLTPDDLSNLFPKATQSFWEERCFSMYRIKGGKDTYIKEFTLRGGVCKESYLYLPTVLVWGRSQTPELKGHFLEVKRNQLIEYKCITYEYNTFYQKKLITCCLSNICEGGLFKIVKEDIKTVPSIYLREYILFLQEYVFLIRENFPSLARHVIWCGLKRNSLEDFKIIESFYPNLKIPGSLSVLINPDILRYCMEEKKWFLVFVNTDPIEQEFRHIEELIYQCTLRNYKSYNGKPNKESMRYLLNRRSQLILSYPNLQQLTILENV